MGTNRERDGGRARVVDDGGDVAEVLACGEGAGLEGVELMGAECGEVSMSREVGEGYWKARWEENR